MRSRGSATGRCRSTASGSRGTAGRRSTGRLAGRSRSTASRCRCTLDRSTAAGRGAAGVYRSAAAVPAVLLLKPAVLDLLEAALFLVASTALFVATEQTGFDLISTRQGQSRQHGENGRQSQNFATHCSPPAVHSNWKVAKQLKRKSNPTRVRTSPPTGQTGMFAWVALDAKIRATRMYI